MVGKGTGQTSSEIRLIYLFIIPFIDPFAQEGEITSANSKSLLNYLTHHVILREVVQSQTNFKKGDPEEAGNNRPVSLTSVLCKIFEKLLKRVLLLFLTAIRSLSPSQHGFLPRRSCLSNLILQEGRATRLLDEGHTVDLVYLDFAKAFDSVNHRFRLAELKSSGIDGAMLNWIKSYTSNRYI